MTDMTIPISPDIKSFVRDLIPDGSLGAVGYRSLVSEAIARWEARDQEEADDYRPQRFLPTADIDVDMHQINSAADLMDLHEGYGLRDDWHEPDNNGITAYVTGNHLDNAMGPTTEHAHGELNVVIAYEQDSEGSVRVYKPVAVINLATLLSWATDGYRSHQALMDHI